MPVNRKISFITVFVIAALGFIAYVNSLGGEFIWDDYHLVKNNAYIRDPSRMANFFTEDIGAGAFSKFPFYRPVQMLANTADYAVWKFNVTGYHITNLILHILVALCVCWLCNTLFRDNVLSLIAGALFVTHPVHTEAVSYISGRAESLAALFILLCFIFYAKNLRMRKIWMSFLTIICYTLALLSKEVAVMLPAVLLFYHYSFGKKINARNLLSVTLLSAAYITVRLTVLSPILSVHRAYGTAAERLPGFFAAITSYVRLLIAPFGLHMEYTNRLFPLTDFRVVTGVFLAALLIIYAFRKKSKENLIFFSIGWFFLWLFPVANIFPVNAYMAEHWLYLPSAGFFIIIAGYLARACRAPGHRTVAVSFTAALVIFYSFLTIAQNKYWRTPFDFLERTVRYAPDSPRLISDLGNMYIHKGETEKAERLIARAIRIDPYFAPAYNSMGTLYAVRGDGDKAAEFFERAVALEPAFCAARVNMAKSYEAKGETEKAVSVLKKTVEMNPDFGEAYHVLGVIYKRAGNNEKAMEMFAKTAEAAPGNPFAYNDLGVEYAKRGRTEEAVRALKKAIEANPGFAPAYNNLGRIYTKKGNPDDGMALLRKAIELDPELVDAYGNLAIACAGRGRIEEAIRLYEKAIGIDSDYAEGHNNLAVLYYRAGKYRKALGHYKKARSMGYGVNPDLLAAIEKSVAKKP